MRNVSICIIFCHFCRLVQCQVLIIDEISMISSHTLLTMSSILQHVKGNNFPLGGVQRIFCGDFYQLPPVPNASYGDPGEPIYMLKEINLFLPHKVELVQVSAVILFCGSSKPMVSAVGCSGSYKVSLFHLINHCRL